MKRLILASLLLAPPALAAEPTTIILPTPLVSDLGQYLAQRPYGEVAQLIGMLQTCIAVQMPNPHGSVVGVCPAVTAALRAHADKSADAKK